MTLIVHEIMFQSSVKFSKQKQIFVDRKRVYRFFRYYTFFSFYEFNIKDKK